MISFVNWSIEWNTFLVFFLVKSNSLYRDKWKTSEYDITISIEIIHKEFDWNVRFSISCHGVKKIKNPSKWNEMLLKSWENYSIYCKNENFQTEQWHQGCNTNEAAWMTIQLFCVLWMTCQCKLASCNTNETKELCFLFPCYRMNWKGVI